MKFYTISSQNIVQSIFSVFNYKLIQFPDKNYRSYLANNYYI